MSIFHPFKISMQLAGDVERELYGQGESFTEALTNLMKAVDEYGDVEDRAALMQGLDEVEGCIARARANSGRARIGA